MFREPLFWLIAVPVAVGMEFWAMFLHGRLWHGALWPAHRSHHVPRTGPFEFNDVFALFHATIAMALVMYGLHFRATVPAAIGFGMTAFGLSYFVVHDGLIHGRLPVGFLARIGWIKRIRNAHQVHHKLDAGPYGLFLGPWELRRTAAERRRGPA